jgi:hypothetical protein
MLKSCIIYMGSHSHDHVIPDIKYTVKDVFAADTLIDIFMENNQHCTPICQPSNVHSADSY